MTLLALDRAVAAGRFARTAQLLETYVPKTGQIDQTGQRIEKDWKIGTSPGQKLTSRPAKPASAYEKPPSGTVQQPYPAAQDVLTPIDFNHVRPSGVPQ